MPDAQVVEVPGASDMDDPTFINHLNKRHRADLPMPSVTYSPAQTEGLTLTWRAFHRRLHSQKSYSHEHDGEN